MSSLSSSRQAPGTGVTALPRGRSWMRRTLLGLAGIVAVVTLWWVVLTLIAGPESLAAQFLPTRAFAALPSLIDAGLVDSARPTVVVHTGGIVSLFVNTESFARSTTTPAFAP